MTKRYSITDLSADQLAMLLGAAMIGLAMVNRNVEQAVKDTEELAIFLSITSDEEFNDLIAKIKAISKEARKE